MSKPAPPDMSFPSMSSINLRSIPCADGIWPVSSINRTAWEWILKRLLLLLLLLLLICAPKNWAKPAQNRTASSLGRCVSCLCLFLEVHYSDKLLIDPIVPLVKRYHSLLDNTEQFTLGYLFKKQTRCKRKFIAYTYTEDRHIVVFLWVLNLERETNLCKIKHF